MSPLAPAPGAVTRSIGAEKYPSFEGKYTRKWVSTLGIQC